MLCHHFQTQLINDDDDMPCYSMLVIPDTPDMLSHL